MEVNEELQYETDKLKHALQWSNSKKSICKTYNF